MIFNNAVALHKLKEEKVKPKVIRRKENKNEEKQIKYRIKHSRINKTKI